MERFQKYLVEKTSSNDCVKPLTSKMSITDFTKVIGLQFAEGVIYLHLSRKEK